MNDLLGAALDYAGRGWPVFPCVPRDKRPLTEHGLRDATTDPDVVRGWWAKHPTANVAVRTGVAFDVLDLDRPQAGQQLAELAQTVGAPMPECWGWGPMVVTAKGHHLWYQPTGAGNRARVHGIDGFDWRGRDGYIVAPPSTHPSGHVYTYHEHCGPDAPIPAAPAFLVELVRQPTTAPVVPTPPQRVDVYTNRSRSWSAAGLFGKMAVAVEGERNTVLHWCAARVGEDVRAGKVAEDVAISALEQLADVARRAGLGDLEVAATIRSGYRS